MTYFPLSEDSAAQFLGKIPDIATRLGGASESWQVKEVGDGNLNLVFIVAGPNGGVVAKQALPYVRLIGESWPLPLSRAYYERLALADEAKIVPDRVPALLHHDDDMALTVMEYLTPHRTLRGCLVEGERYPLLADHMAEFLADTLFFTSDLAVAPEVKKERVAAYLGNTAMCKITEDLIFDEPYFAAEMNAHTAGLDALVAELRADTPLRVAAQELKAKFLAAPEALLHGDVHSGSLMVTADDTKVIDCEFAFYGPIGFDVGMFLSNLLMAWFAQAGQRPDVATDPWLLDQVHAVWTGFADRFAGHMRSRTSDGSGALYALSPEDKALREAGIAARLNAIWNDTVGFCGVETIRRIIGLAHVADFESIEDEVVRAACEARALRLARAMLIDRAAFPDIDALIATAKKEGGA